MRRIDLFILFAALLAAATAGAQDLGLAAPPKSPSAPPPNYPSPEFQGGDTIASATVISTVPYNDTGTTTGYMDNYDEVCPYANATAPDVVYRFSPSYVVTVDIDLCGSTYDTKLYVYDSGLNVVACNDDFYFSGYCGIYVSRIENVTLLSGNTYYIVIDGYGGAHGDYMMSIDVYIPCCSLSCPPTGLPEGEPPLEDDYVDNWNGGCNTPGYPFQPLTGDQDGALILCGVGGWYDFQGSDYRDTDWYLLSMGPEGHIEITADAEQTTYIFELGPQDCDAVGVVQQATVGPCAQGYMSIGGYAAGAPVWFWVGSTVFTPPGGYDCMYTYLVWFTGLYPGPVAATPTTWSTVKALYD